MRCYPQPAFRETPDGAGSPSTDDSSDDHEAAAAPAGRRAHRVVVDPRRQPLAVIATGIERELMATRIKPRVVQEAPHPAAGQVVDGDHGRALRRGLELQ